MHWWQEGCSGGDIDHEPFWHWFGFLYLYNQQWRGYSFCCLEGIVSAVVHKTEELLQQKEKQKSVVSALTAIVHYINTCPDSLPGQQSRLTADIVATGIRKMLHSKQLESVFEDKSRNMRLKIIKLLDELAIQFKVEKEKEKKGIVKYFVQLSADFLCHARAHVDLGQVEDNHLWKRWSCPKESTICSESVWNWYEEAQSATPSHSLIAISLEELRTEIPFDRLLSQEPIWKNRCIMVEVMAGFLSTPNTAKANDRIWIVGMLIKHMAEETDSDVLLAALSGLAEIIGTPEIGNVESDSSMRDCSPTSATSGDHQNDRLHAPEGAYTLYLSRRSVKRGEGGSGHWSLWSVCA
jgi:hypothetical protein